MTEPLTITTSPRDDHQLDMTIQLGPERTQEALLHAAKHVAQRVNIPGFRRGKAPFAVVLRTYGREALLNEIVDELGQTVYSEALTTEKIEPFSQAALVDVQMDPLTFKLVVPLEPTVDLGDYRSIRLEQPEVKVTDEDVEAWIEARRTQQASWQVVERPAEIGDSITVDIQGKVGEDSIMDNHDWELVLKAEGGWLPGFDEAFVGMSAGEEKTFTLRYPEDSSSRYKGQEATFEATVKQVKANVKPELNDDLAKTLGDFESVEDMRSKVRTRLEEQRGVEADNKLTNDAVQALVDGATALDYPPVVVEEAADEMVRDLERRLSEIGYKLEDYLRLQSTNVAEYREKVRPSAEARAKQRLVLAQLAQLEKIEVTAEEIQAETDRISEGVQGRPDGESMRDLLSSDTGKQIVANDLMTAKTLERLRAIVTGQALPEPGAAEVPTEEASAAAQPAADSEAPASAEAPAVKTGSRKKKAGAEGEPTIETPSEA